MAELPPIENEIPSENTADEKRRLRRRRLLWILSSPFLLVILALLLLQIHSVQTWLARRAAVHFSEEWQRQVEIDRLSVDLWGQVQFSNFLIRDHKQDTLVYVPNFTLTSYDYDFSTGDFKLQGVRLEQGVVKLIRYKSEDDWNYKFLIDYFSTDTQQEAPNTESEFSIESIELVENELTYFDQNAPLVNGGEWNFDQFKLEQLNLKLSDLFIAKDEINLNLLESRFTESYSKFACKQLQGKIKITPVSYEISELKVESNQSQFIGEASISVADTTQWKYADSLMQIRLAISNLHIVPEDFVPFSNELKGLSQAFDIRGLAEGNLKQFVISNATINTGNSTAVSGNLVLNNLNGKGPFQYTFSNAQIETNYADLMRIPNYPFNSGVPLPIPINVSYLGEMKFKGEISGSSDDAKLSGEFNSAIGKLTTDIEVKGFSSVLNYSGALELDNFNLASYYQSPDLGIVTANLTISGKGTELSDLELYFKGDITECGLMGYTYRNIQTDGTFKKQFYDGHLTLDDPNAKAVFDGQIDFSKKEPFLDFDLHVEKLNLSQTHIMNDGNSVVVSGNFHAAFQGLDINTIKGELIGEEVVYEKNGQCNRIEYFTLDSEQAENRQLTLNSEIGQISLTGKFNFVDLTASIQDIIAEVLPGFKSSGKKHNPQDFEIVARINDFSFIQAAFIPELTLSEGTSLNLKVNEKEQILDGTFGSEKIMFENLTIKGAVADFTRSEGSIYLSVSSDQILNNDTLLLNTIALDARSLGDTIFSSLTWGNSSDWLTGDVNGVFFLRSLSDLRYEFESSTITLNGEIWKFDERGEIDVCQNELAMQNFGLSNGNQYVIINGVVSDSPYEQITIDLNNIALAQLNPYLSDAAQLIGELDGSVALRNLYESPIATADLTFSDLGVNSYQIGNMCVKSNWEPERKRVRVDGELDQNGQSPLRFAGSYYPFQEQNSLDFLITLNSFDLNVLNAFLGPDVLTLEGRASTMLSVKGEPNSPELNGELHLQETKIGVPFLKTTYTLSDKIKITEDMFTFSNVKLMDEENHAGVATGQVLHEEFQKWSYDVIIEMETPMLVMNTQEEDNSDFYGKAYATGYAEISGYDDKTEFEIVMKSEKGTTFNLPMSSSGDLQFDSFIRFVNPKDTIKKEEPKANLSGISLNMQLDVTEDAEFQVIFDEAVGDVMKGRGKGHLSLTVNQLSTLGMYGFLEVTEGTYLFTLKNLVNKPFAVKPGGYIAWYGDPLKGELDLKAMYKASANLNDLMNDPTQNTGKRTPVNLIMNLQGKMLNPTIGFDIELPQSDELTKSRIASVISTEQERNRQAFALLVMGRFVTPPNISELAQQGGTGGIANNGSELLSSQISNWLSQISDDFDLGFNYRPGDKISNEEIELALSTQLFNDRITVSGNFGVARGNSENQSTNYIGDIRIEYNITKDGRVKLMVFNESNNQRLSAATQSPYTQGVGVVYQEEFDNWNEFVSGLKSLFDKENLKLTQ